MIPNKLLTKYYVITAIIILAFIFLGYQTSRLIGRLGTGPLEDHHSVFFAKLIDHIDPKDRAHALAEITDWNTGGLPYHFELVGASGVVLFPPDGNPPPAWDSLVKPKAPYAYQIVRVPGPAGRPISHTLIRFDGNPVQYLYVWLDRGRGRSPSMFFYSAFGFLVVSVLLGLAVSLILLFNSLQTKVKLADSVLAELQRGNLKARFPIRKMDEIGQAMSRFNRMADEIERLVEQLRSVERSRMALLQELAHDLRTPVASLKSLLETLQSKAVTLAPTLREELHSLALKEVDYFERLVEDLLILAQISEPRYKAEPKLVSMNELLDDEAESMAFQYQSGEKKIALHKSIPDRNVLIQGDTHLLRRMIRNVLNNAFSFAATEVNVTLSVEDGTRARIVVEDDGCGFSAEALASFGERRVSRMVGTSAGNRLSVGLGSVIIKTVARIHGGSASPENRVLDGNASGARVSLFLPTSAASS